MYEIISTGINVSETGSDKIKFYFCFVFFCQEGLMSIKVICLFYLLVTFRSANLSHLLAQKEKKNKQKSGVSILWRLSSNGRKSQTEEIMEERMRKQTFSTVSAGSLPPIADV